MEQECPAKQVLCMTRSREDKLFERFCRQGDPAALGEVFDRTAPELWRVASHLARNREAAEDLVQATFLAAIEGAARYDSTRELVPWLVGIMANLARSQRRSEGRKPDPHRLGLPESRDPFDDAADQEFGVALRQALETLPRPFREVITMHLQHGLRAGEISDLLDRPGGTVRTQLVRGLEMLRKALPAGFAAGVAGLASTTAQLASMRAKVLLAGEEYRIGVLSSTAASGLLGGLLLMNKPLLAIVTGMVVASLSWFGWDHWNSPKGTSVTILPESASVELPAADSEATSESQLTVDEPVRRDVKVEPETIQAKGLVVTGKVFSMEKKGPVAAARIFLDGTTPQMIALSDAAGYFTVENIPQGGSLYARAEGHEPSLTSVIRGAPGAHVEMDLMLWREARRVRGVILDNAGLPVPRAVIHVGVDSDIINKSMNKAIGGFFGGMLKQAMPTVRRSFSLTAGESGEFDTAEIPSGRQLILAEGPEGRSDERGFLFVDGSEDANVTVLLDVDTEVHGRVRDLEGRAVADQEVRFALADGKPYGSFTDNQNRQLLRHHAITDANGDYIVRGLLPGEYYAEAGNPLALSRFELAVNRGEKKRLDLLVSDGDPMEIQVFAGGQPCAAWQVVLRLRELHLRTDAPTPFKQLDREGCTQLNVAPGDRVTVSFHPPDADPLLPSAYRVKLRALPGRQRIELTEEEWPTACIRGRLVSASADPVRNVPYRLKLKGWPEDVQGYTAVMDGRFEVSPLPPGSYVLTLEPEGEAAIILDGLQLKAYEQMELGDIGIVKSGSLEIELSELLDNVQIGVRPVGGGKMESAHLSKGTYKTGPLAPGDYTIQVLAAGRIPLRLNTHVQAERPSLVSLRLEAGKEVAITARFVGGWKIGGKESPKIDLPPLHPRGWLELRDSSGAVLVRLDLEDSYDEGAPYCVTRRISMPPGTFKVVAFNEWSQTTATQLLPALGEENNSFELELK